MGVVLGITGALVINALTTKETEIVLFELMEHVPIVLKLDGFGKLFLAIVSIVWILAGCFSFTYMKHEKNEKRYFGFYLVTFGVLVGLGCAGNLITMYAFYEFMTLVSFPLVIHNQSKEAVMAGLKYLFYSFFGAYMALFGLFFLCRYTTTLTFTAGGTLNMELVAGHETLLLVAACLMLVGFGVKAGTRMASYRTSGSTGSGICSFVRYYCQSGCAGDCTCCLLSVWRRFHTRNLGAVSVPDTCFNYRVYGLHVSVQGKGIEKTSGLFNSQSAFLYSVWNCFA